MRLRTRTVYRHRKCVPKTASFLCLHACVCHAAFAVSLRDRYKLNEETTDREEISTTEIFAVVIRVKQRFEHHKDTRALSFLSQIIQRPSTVTSLSCASYPSETSTHLDDCEVRMHQQKNYQRVLRRISAAIDHRVTRCGASRSSFANAVADAQ